MHLFISFFLHFTLNISINMDLYTLNISINTDLYRFFSFVFYNIFNYDNHVTTQLTILLINIKNKT
jgi:hypothetical protein